MITEKLIINPKPTYHNSNDKNTGHTGGKLCPQNKGSLRLQELSLKNNTYFGTSHYAIHLDMKLDYTISRIFQEMSLSELETLHHLCEPE